MTFEFSAGAVAAKQLSLGDEINYATATLHHELNMIIMSRLPLGLKDPKAFHEGLASFSLIYFAFESSLDSHIRSASTPARVRSILEPVYQPVLHRAAVFEKDLEAFSREGNEFQLNRATPARSYVLDYVRRSTNERPHVLLAYCHCLYMALFAGGQHIKSAIARAAVRKLSLAAHQVVPEEAKTPPGVGLFTFGGRSTKEEQELRQKLRDGIREAETRLTPKERAEVVAEANEVFKLTRRLVDELDVMCETSPTVLVATKQYTESESSKLKAGGATANTGIPQPSRFFLSKRVKTVAKGVICVAALLGYMTYLSTRSTSGQIRQMQWDETYVSDGFDNGHSAMNGV